MKKNILYIVGAVALLGGGAFLFLKFKKKKDQTKLADLNTKKAIEVAKFKEQEDIEIAKKLLSANKLKEEILANITRKGTYKRSATRNAVQQDIDKQLIALKELGFTLKNNELVKIN